MRIAIPVVNGKLAAHFGHCEAFEMLDVDTATKEITARETLTAPPHQPGLLPMWLAEQKAEVVLAGGMGSRAIQGFAARGIEVVVGVPSGDPQALALAHVEGTLQTGGNVCDH